MIWAGSSTNGWEPWPGISTTSAVPSTVGSLETRVLATARRFRELGVTGDELPEGMAIEQTTRGLMAPELTPPAS